MSDEHRVVKTNRLWCHDVLFFCFLSTHYHESISSEKEERRDKTQYIARAGKCFWSWMKRSPRRPRLVPHMPPATKIPLFRARHKICYFFVIVGTDNTGPPFRYIPRPRVPEKSLNESSAPEGFADAKYLYSRDQSYLNKIFIFCIYWPGEAEKISIVAHRPINFTKVPQKTFSLK